MPRRPLEDAIAAAQRDAAEAAALARAAEAKLAALLVEQARLVDQVVAAEHREAVLHNRHGDARIDTMDTQITVPGARLEAKHPGAKKIRQVDGSIARFAAKHKLAVTTVRSWYARGDAAREIPRKWADLLAAEPYGIPLTAWKNGIGE